MSVRYVSQEVATNWRSAAKHSLLYFKVMNLGGVSPTTLTNN